MYMYCIMKKQKQLKVVLLHSSFCLISRNPKHLLH